MDVAGRWHEKLLDSNKNKSPEAEIEREFLRIAALLHDYGHLPFSHLFEEIFDELHWFPSPRRERSWHEVRTRWKFDKLLEERLGSKGTVREYIKDSSVMNPMTS